ncbi:hypothetical protein [Sorangium sp. So ce1335]|uniref:hypothetical protein n=1 Tax=Sorangium sp. So ce1335 TaxID=3133335 RepID=UPI003F5FEEA4
MGDVTRLVSVIGTVASDATVTIRETTSERELLDQLAALLQDDRRFDVVVAIGHSNETGIRIASDRFAPWDAFASYLKPFEPRRLMLVACQAGRWPAATVLFRKLPKLRRIFASPVNASKDLATLMLAMVPYLLEVKAPRDHAVRIGQAVSVVLTGRQVRQWMRTRDKDNPEGLLLDEAAQFVDPYLRHVPGILVSVFK